MVRRCMSIPAPRSSVTGSPLTMRLVITRTWSAMQSKPTLTLRYCALLAKLGSGFDIVSGGELARVLEAGGDPARIVFSGVGKTAAEMEQALDAGIRCFNVESTAELSRLNEVAATHGSHSAGIAPRQSRCGCSAPILIFPPVSRKTNSASMSKAPKTAYQQAADAAHLRVEGIDCHIGSQLTEITPFVDALDACWSWWTHRATGHRYSVISISAADSACSTAMNTRRPRTDYVRPLLARLANSNKEILIEPGRAIAANAGILLTEVQYLKESADKNFAIVDAAMNDLVRPSLYSAWQDIVPVIASERPTKAYDVVGPVCETGDFLGKQRPLCIAAGRPAGGTLSRRLWIHHELELQQPAARRRNPC